LARSPDNRRAIAHPPPVSMSCVQYWHPKALQDISFDHLPDLIGYWFPVIHQVKLEPCLKALTQSIDCVLMNQTSCTQQCTLQSLKRLPFHSSDKFLEANSW
jgi:hypothetical protein